MNTGNKTYVVFVVTAYLNESPCIHLVCSMLLEICSMCILSCLKNDTNTQRSANCPAVMNVKKHVSVFALQSAAVF